jgi:tRNA_anti-like
MKKKILLIGVVLLIGLSVGLYLYMYQDRRDVSAEEAKYSVTVLDLQSQFIKDLTGSNAKYLDKAIEVSGIVTSIDTAEHSVVLDEKLSAVFLDSTLAGVALQKSVSIKGRFLGYDDLLEELKIDDASLAK